MNKHKSFSTLLCIFIGIIIAAIIKIFVFEAVTVEGDSMEPTIVDNQTIYINKLRYGLVNPLSSSLLVKWDSPKENDIIVYLYNNNLVVKRCVATENMPLDYLANSKYSLIVNSDKKIPLNLIQYNNLKNCNSVPTGYVLAIGDNYLESFDSRNYGFISVSDILGKVICK